MITDRIIKIKETSFVFFILYTPLQLRSTMVAYQVIKDAANYDIDAMSLIQRHFDPYIRRLATICAHGTNYLNEDLYNRLKTRLIMATLKFKL